MGPAFLQQAGRSVKTSWRVGAVALATRLGKRQHRSLQGKKEAGCSMPQDGASCFKRSGLCAEWRSRPARGCRVSWQAARVGYGGGILLHWLDWRKKLILLEKL